MLAFGADSRIVTACGAPVIHSNGIEAAILPAPWGRIEGGIPRLASVSADRYDFAPPIPRMQPFFGMSVDAPGRGNANPVGATVPQRYFLPPYCFSISLANAAGSLPIMAFICASCCAGVAFSRFFICLPIGEAVKAAACF